MKSLDHLCDHLFDGNHLFDHLFNGAMNDPGME